MLVSDPAVHGPRPTKDVDVVVHATTKIEFSKTEKALRQLGFRQDMSEDAPICRYLLPGGGVNGRICPSTSCL